MSTIAKTNGKKAAKAEKPSKVGAAASWADDRLGLATLGKKNLRKVFPDHWSFMLGEIALWSFVVLLLTGVFLTLWFRPSMVEVVYDGSYDQLRGIPMSEAYASTLDISFDVRGGLLMRQIHHWAAMIFVAAMMIHLLRVYFTGAFRKPRELNWVIGALLLLLGTLEGFTGYSLPDDLLSGTGIRAADGFMKSMPVVGTYMSFFLFGGEFPGESIIPRLFTAHVLLIPGLLLALIAAHMLLLVYHKHTQWPGPGRTEQNVVGFPMLPVYAAKAGGFFFMVFGVLALMVSLMTFYGLTWAAGGNDILAIRLHLSINQITYFMRGAVFIGPLIAFIITRRWCISLQRHDNDKLLHGLESGVIMRDPQGGYSEKHIPLPAAQAYTLTARNRDEVFTPTSEADANGVESPTARKDKVRARLSRFWHGNTIQKPTRAELEEGHHHAELETAHDAELGHAADGHQFDGRHDVSGDELSTKH